MNRSNDPLNSDRDDRLADFTDRVLNGQAGETDSNADDELRGLEETILRLNQSLPHASPDKASAMKMLVRLKARMRKDDARMPNLLSNRRPASILSPWGMVIGVLAVALAFVLALPLLGPSNSSTSATALGSPLGIFSAILLAGLIAFTLWITRRK
jgi:hypothetical protein